MSLDPPLRSAFANGAMPTDPSLVAFYEGLVGIGTTARVCQHLLRRNPIDIVELQTMLQSIVTSADETIAILRD